MKDQHPPVLCSPLVSLAGCLLSVLAMMLAGLLAVWSLQAGMTPPGCGEGSGCASVLGSKWSQIFGIPVGVGAALLYLVLARLFLRRKPAPFFGGMVTGALLGGIAWFVGVQLVLIRAICFYCMVDHVLGGAAAVVYLMSGREVRRTGIPAGVGCALLLAVVQAISPDQEVFQLFGGDQARMIRMNGQRRVVLIEGQSPIVPSREPHFGNPDAERLVMIAVDYACPHCRNLHRFARQAVEANPDHLGVVMLPTPIHPSCNPAMTQVPERFEHGCETARLSLAVFLDKPEAWTDFDRWLFEDPMPKPIDEVRARAGRLISLSDDRLLAEADSRLQRNVNLFLAMPIGDGDRRVPVTWGVGRPPVIGPIFELEDFLNLTVPLPNEGDSSHE